MGVHVTIYERELQINACATKHISAHKTHTSSTFLLARVHTHQQTHKIHVLQRLRSCVQREFTAQIWLCGFKPIKRFILIINTPTHLHSFPLAFSHIQDVPQWRGRVFPLVENTMKRHDTHARTNITHLRTSTNIRSFVHKGKNIYHSIVSNKLFLLQLTTHL